jgi:hypothetical protein
MSSSKKVTLKRGFAAGVYLSEAQNPILTPPYILYTVYVYVCTLYSILMHSGGGGLNIERGERGKRGEYGSQSWVENTNMAVELKKLAIPVYKL